MGPCYSESAFLAYFEPLAALMVLFGLLKTPFCWFLGFCSKSRRTFGGVAIPPQMIKQNISAFYFA